MAENLNLNSVETVDTRPFRKLVMTIGELPTSYIESMTYYELLTWLTNYLENTVIPTVNNNAESVEELQDLFVELKSFVDNYFDNLDVQDEIDDKLDRMAESGELLELIKNYVDPFLEKFNNYLKGEVKFHAIKASSSVYITEFPNGKNMIIDTGTTDQWSNIKTAIDNLGITKFDYVVITHFHPDHHGNIQNLIDNYDVKNANWYVQLKPDYTNFSDYILNPESEYTDQISLIESNGITPIVPNNNSIIDIDTENNIKIRFLNTSPSIARNYYSRYSENGQLGTEFNNFSLITEITHNNVKILSTGDIERPVEDQYASYLTKVNVITAPHHSVNRDANRAFYYGSMPDYAVILMPSLSAQPTYRQLEYYKEIGTKVIASYSSEPVNGLYTFISDGYTVSCNALYSAYTDEIFNYSRPLVHIGSIINTTSYNESEITLIELLNNMPKGSQLIQRWTSGYNTTLANITNDIKTIFPKFNHNMTVMLRALYTSYEIRVYDGKDEMIATTPASNINWRKSGRGLTDENIETQANLINYLVPLTPGLYAVNYYKDTNGDSGVLQTDAGYLLNISKTSAGGAMILAVLKQAGTGTDKTRVAAAYVSGLNTETPNIIWHKINN